MTMIDVMISNHLISVLRSPLPESANVTPTPVLRTTLSAQKTHWKETVLSVPMMTFKNVETTKPVSWNTVSVLITCVKMNSFVRENTQPLRSVLNVEKVQTVETSKSVMILEIVFVEMNSVEIMFAPLKMLMECVLNVEKTAKITVWGPPPAQLTTSVSVLVSFVQFSLSVIRKDLMGSVMLQFHVRVAMSASLNPSVLMFKVMMEMIVLACKTNYWTILVPVMKMELVMIFVKH